MLVRVRIIDCMREGIQHERAAPVSSRPIRGRKSLHMHAAAVNGEGRMSLPLPLHDRLRLPVIGAPMFIVSGPELVLAQCMAGIVGSFPALNARPYEMLDICSRA